MNNNVKPKEDIYTSKVVQNIYVIFLLSYTEGKIMNFPMNTIFEDQYWIDMFCLIQ